MSTEPVIPERWQDHYACIVDGEIEDAQLEQQLMQELGTAESLVRELARALQDVDALIGHELPTLLLMRDGGPITQCKLLITAALSRIPKEVL